MRLAAQAKEVPFSHAYHAELDAWLSRLVSKAVQTPLPLAAVIVELKQLVETHADLFMLFSSLFADGGPKKSEEHHASFRVKDSEHMFQLMNLVLTESPEFNTTGLVGILPMYSLFNCFLGTQAGATLFLEPRVNAQLRRILDEWAAFLRSEASCSFLNAESPRGWFSEDARQLMPEFEKTFICSPLEPHYGFLSWDAFFTRRFRPSMRPVAAPDDPSIIVNACESAPYKLSTAVGFADRFWVKNYPYSLRHLLANDELAESFIGGTVYQALLSAFNYHRWHSPVDGTIVRAFVEQGSYYYEAPSAVLDTAGLIDSQAYTAHLSTRAIIFIEADNPDIGLMCLLPVGMVEVSTCELTIRSGQRVKKGDEVGMFHFGGSTHCLLFRPGVHLTFDLHGQTPGLDSANIYVNETIAMVRTKVSSKSRNAVEGQS